MSAEPPAPPAPPEPDGPPAEGGVGIESSRDVVVGGDVAGRDIVRTTTTVGFSAAQVQRIVITVGVLVFVTAACFFSGGVVLGGAVFAALARPVGSSEEAAAAMQAKLQIIQALPPGQPFRLTFTEEEISSYVKFVIGEQLGFARQTGRVRLLPQTGQLVVAGQVRDLNNLQVVAAFELQSTPGAPLRLTGAAAQLLPLRDSAFGWVAIPLAPFRSVADNMNSLLGNVQLVDVQDVSSTPDQPAWAVTGVTR